MDALLNYGYESDDLFSKEENLEKLSEANENQIQKWNHQVDDEIILYDNNLTFDENFNDGKEVKYVLIPIYKNPKNDYNDFTPLLNAGAKVIMNKKNILEDYSEGLNYIVLDYDSIFGLRLLSFEKYNSTFFSCEERVFFETLMIKFKSFKYQKFYYSYPKIYEELGLKKDKANTIVKKFIRLGILNSEIQTTFMTNRPSQITYYELNVEKIIELIPKIYKSAFHDDIEEKLNLYLRPALVK